MKLIFFLSLVLIPLYMCEEFRVIEALSKYGMKTYYPSTYGDKCAVYVKTSDFPKDDMLYFRTTIKYGYFKDYYIRYGAFDSIGNTVTLTSSAYRTSETYSGYYYSYYYDYYSLFFNLVKTNKPYFYVAAPPVSYYSSKLAFVEVESTNSTGISIWVWIGIGIFVVVCIIVSVVTYYVRRRGRSYVVPTSVEPIVSPSPYVPPPAYY
jgi:hypothetical protein